MIRGIMKTMIVIMTTLRFNLITPFPLILYMYIIRNYSCFSFMKYQNLVWHTSTITHYEFRVKLVVLKSNVTQLFK